jgi:hypothetical protein
VRPAWALTWRWKSSRELVVAIEANRRASRREDDVKEAGSENRGPMDKKRLRGDAGQGERTNDREALTTKAQAA